MNLWCQSHGWPIVSGPVLCHGNGIAGKAAQDLCDTTAHKGPKVGN